MNFLDRYQWVLRQAEQLESLSQSLERTLVFHREVAPVLQSQEHEQTEQLAKRIKRHLEYLLYMPIEQNVDVLRAIETRTGDPLVTYALARTAERFETYRDLYAFVYHLGVLSERYPDAFESGT